MFNSGNPDVGHSGSPEPTPPTAGTRRGDPRRRILDAMVKTVSRRGYDRTTVSRVLTIAEVPEPLFDEHFEDKYECFMQAVEELIAPAEQAARERFARPGSWSERVRAGLRDLLAGLAANPDGARVVFVEMLAAGPPAGERHRRALALFTALVEQGRSQAPHASRLPPQTSEAIVGGIASIVHRRVLQNETAQLPSLHADLTYFALLPYLDQEGAMREAALPRAA